MESEIYYGKIKPEKLKTWNTNNNPYDILENKIEFVRASGWDFLGKADNILRERTQVDWGSFAYKATYSELIALREALRCEIPELETYSDEKEFGVIFIEMP